MFNFHFILISSPFDEDKFLGWAAVFCSQLLAGSIFPTSNLATVSFLLTNEFYFEASANHFRSIFSDVKGIINKKPTIETRLRLRKALIEAVDFHNTIKR